MEVKISPPRQCLHIGWDVGAWHADKNTKSRDAVVILDNDGLAIGTPWRGNLRSQINECGDSRQLLRTLLGLCEVELPPFPLFATVAIDTPLGFPTGFVDLVHRGVRTEVQSNRVNNPYLFRQTERRLFERGFTPLSAVQDMLGSQATKGIHFRSKFTPNEERCGVWTDGVFLRVIETYPSPCRNNSVITSIIDRLPELPERMSRGRRSDVNDARICAAVAYLFEKCVDDLEGPPASVSLGEGWIWVPR